MAADIKGLMCKIDEVCGKVPNLPRQEVVLTRLMYFLFREINDALNSRLAPYGLNTTSFIALMNIFASPTGAIHPLELSNAMYSSRTNITRLVDELAGNGWVNRQPCSKDKRKVFLRLTDDGLNLVHKVLPVQAETMKDVWRSLTGQEAVQMQNYMVQVLLNIKSS